MDAEERKRLEEIKTIKHRTDAENWLIAQLEAAEARAKTLRQELSVLVGREQTIVNARDVQCEGRKRAEARAEELERLFALQQTRMGEATEAWREATGKHDVLPDLGDLLAWLLSTRETLEAECRRMRERLEELPFRSLLNWFMCSDLWPASDIDHVIITTWIEKESLNRGHKGWLAAYHEEPDAALTPPEALGLSPEAEASVRRGGKEEA